MTTRKNKTYKHRKYHKYSKKNRKNRKNRKTKNIHRKKNFSKKNKKYKSKIVKKGGYGNGSCPFVGSDPWNANGYSYLYPISKNGVAVGGVPVYSKQKGGDILQQITPQFLLNTGRVASTSAKNFINNYNGLKEEVSPLPMDDQLSENNLRKMGL